MKCISLVVVVLVLHLIPASFAWATPFIITKIADTSTPSPSGGVFTLLGYPSGEPVPPAISGANVVFEGTNGADLGNQLGIYISQNGALGKVADLRTSIPGGSGFFSGLSRYIVSGNTVDFVGVGSSFGKVGIYEYSNGTLRSLVDNNTAVVGTSGNFTSMGAPDAGKNGTYFSGSGNGQLTRGIYEITSDGSVHKVIGTSTAVPGGTGNFDSIDGDAAAGNELVFVAHSAQSGSGLYRNLNGVNSVIADNHTILSDGTGRITGVNNRSVGFDGTDVAFTAANTGKYALFRTINGQIIRVISNGDTVAGYGRVTISDFVAVALSNNHMVFSTDEGIFSDMTGVIAPVITDGSKLFGKTIESLYFSSESFDGTSIAFAARFTDNSSGVYVAALPAPPVTPVPLPPGAWLSVPVAIGVVFRARHVSRK